MLTNHLVEGIWQYRHGKEYTLFGRQYLNMKARATEGSGYRKRRKEYSDCTMSDDFCSFQLYAEWASKQIGSESENYQLDKDILTKGANKEYSPSNCVFVPREINMFLVNCKSARGELPVGVNWDKQNSKYLARVRDCTGKRIYLGYYDTPEEAFNAYKTAKERYAKKLAEKWKPFVDERVYNALVSYETNITD